MESFLKRIVGKLGTERAEARTLNLLDVGCGTGANLEMLSAFGNAEGVDVSDEALEFCRRKGLSVQKGLAEKLPYEDRAFEITTALDVVEHLEVAGTHQERSAVGSAAGAPGRKVLVDDCAQDVPPWLLPSADPPRRRD